MSVLNIDDSLLLIIDIQEKLLNAAFNKNDLFRKAEILAKTAKVLNIPYVVTEQYPNGLGGTIPKIADILSDRASYFEKVSFNALEEEKLLDCFNDIRKSQIILCGIETHICVRQTAFALLNRGFQVSVIKDCCGSRSETEHIAGLDVMKQEGCFIKTTETALFELLKSAKHPNFKEIQALIK